MTIRSVSIIGLGALGVMHGKFLIDKIGKEAVRIVADQKRIKRYQSEGVYDNDELCDFQYVDCQSQGNPADLLIFAVKFGALDVAIDSARNQVGKDTLIISVLNGITSEEKLINAFGRDKVLYCVAQGMDAVKQGNHLTYKNMGWLSIGAVDHSTDDKLETLAQFFDRIQMPYDRPEHIRQHMWSKLMINTGVNQTVTVFETNYGGVQKQGKARDTMIAAMREVIQVAAAEGVTLTEKELWHWLEINDKLDPEGMPSMRQDALAHRKTEVGLFSGTVITLGKMHQILTPVNEFLYQRIREIEAAY